MKLARVGSLLLLTAFVIATSSFSCRTLSPDSDPTSLKVNTFDTTNLKNLNSKSRAQAVLSHYGEHTSNSSDESSNAILLAPTWKSKALSVATDAPSTDSDPKKTTQSKGVFVDSLWNAQRRRERIRYVLCSHKTEPLNCLNDNKVQNTWNADVEQFFQELKRESNETSPQFSLDDVVKFKAADIDHPWTTTKWPFLGKDQTQTLTSAQKIDRLFGDQSETLSNTSKELAKSHVERFAGATHSKDMNILPSWLASGWAAASLTAETEPKKPVTLTSTAGEQISFSPEDVKEIATLHWSRGTYKTAFIGGLCQSDKPCASIRPDLFHQTVARKIGEQQSSIVIDISEDRNVWHRPLTGYQIEFFNPESLKVMSNLDEAIQQIPSENDPFTKERHHQAIRHVGVSMEITFATMKSPDSHQHINHSPDPDTMLLLYELEISKNNKIVGGHWYQQRMPDLLWAPITPNLEPTWGDGFVRGDWDGGTSLPWSWAEGGKFDARSARPLGKVVKLLLEKSQSKSASR